MMPVLLVWRSRTVPWGSLRTTPVSGSAGAGIAIDGATAVRLNGNKVTRADAPGFVIRDGGKVLEMVGNAAYSN